MVPPVRAIVGELDYPYSSVHALVYRRPVNSLDILESLSLIVHRFSCHLALEFTGKVDEGVNKEIKRVRLRNEAPHGNYRRQSSVQSITCDFVHNHALSCI